MAEHDNAGEKPWYREFEHWLTRNKGKHNDLVRIYSFVVLRGLCHGKKQLNDIPLGKRVRLYEATKLPFFAVPDEQNPLHLDMEKVMRGEQPRSLISDRIEYDGLSQEDLAKRIGESRNLLRRYLINAWDIKKDTASRIEQKLTSYFSGSAVPSGPAATVVSSNPSELVKREKLQNTLPVSATPAPNDPYASHAQVLASLVELQKSLSGAYSDALRTLPPQAAAGVLHREVLGEKQLPLEQRINAVVAALDIIADQVDYFRGASQAERDELVKHLDVPILGYVIKTLPHIHQPSSYETILRLMPRPQRGKK